MISAVELHRYIEQVRADWNSVGLAVTVVHGNEVLYTRGFGAREIGRDERIDTDTLFQIGSTTKAFASAALGILVDEGRIHWDDAVIDYLPDFQLQDSWLTRNVTIRDAIAHRSGVSHSYYPFLAIMSPDEAVRQLRYVAPEGAFRDSFVYSNVMYAVLGKVAEAAAGMTWHDFVKRRLLQPLAMDRSGTSPYEFWDSEYVTPAYRGSAPAGRAGFQDARDANVAMPHGGDENGAVVVLPWQSYDAAAPAGSMVSCASDMANWLILHLAEGRFKGQQLLKVETLQELHAPQNPHAGVMPFPFDETRASYAMGWLRTQYRGHTHLAHGGGIAGFPAYVALLPDQKVGVAVLSNSSTWPHKAISLWVFDRLLGAPPRDWSKEFLARAGKLQREAEAAEHELCRLRIQNTSPSLPPEQYAGTYEDEQGHSGPVSVHIEKGRLMLEFAGAGAYGACLEHWQHDVFRLRPKPGVADVPERHTPAFVAFTVDPCGKVASISAFGATLRRLSA